MTKSYPDLEWNVRCLVSQACPAQATTFGATTYTAGNINTWSVGRSGAAGSITDDVDGDRLERRFAVITKFQDFTAFTWDEASLSLFGTGASFASYHWQHLDRVRITGGTGANAGSYIIASKTDDNAIVLTESIGAGADTQTNMAGTVCAYNQPSDAYIDYPGLHTGTLEFEFSGVITGTANIATTAATYTEAAHIVTQTGIFSTYTWTAGDMFHVVSGTGAIPGWYRISRAVDANAIELIDSIGAGANTVTNIIGRLHKAEALHVRLYIANEDGSSPTNLLANPTTLTFPYVLQGTGTAHVFRCKVTLAPISPHSISSDTTAYGVVAEFVQGYATSTSVSQQQEVRQGAVARGTGDLKKNGRFYLTLQKGATSTTMNIIPRNLQVRQFAPMLAG